MRKGVRKCKTERQKGSNRERDSERGGARERKWEGRKRERQGGGMGESLGCHALAPPHFIFTSSLMLD